MSERIVLADEVTNGGDYLIYAKAGGFAGSMSGEGFLDLLGRTPDLTADDFLIIEIN